MGNKYLFKTKMIDTAQLVRLIQNSQLPDELKARFIPVAQVASEEDKKKIKEKVIDYDHKYKLIMEGKIRLTPNDVIVVGKH
jgi:hypothetical protein